MIDLSTCSICGAKATNVVATEKGGTAFCATHFELCWNTLPALLAKLVYFFDEVKHGNKNKT